MFFAIIFWVFIFMIVLCKSLLWLVITFVILFIITIVLAIKKEEFELISLFFIAFSLSIFAFVMKIYFIFENTQGYEWNFATNQELIIKDKLQKNKYIAMDDFSNTFILRNCIWKYNIWDKLLVNWYKNPAQLSWDNFQEYIKTYFIANTNLNIWNEIWKIGEFDYNIRLLMKWYSGIIYAKKDYKIWDIKSSLALETKKSLGNKIKNTFENYDQKYEWFLMGLLIWDKSSLNPYIYQQFIDSWIVHIIAVSGWNIIMIIVFLNFILFFLPFKIKITLILSIIIFYSFICGLDSSVVRATIMGGLWLFALLSGNITNIWRLIQIAFISMLIINPFSIIYDLGFILSFMALVWILISAKLTIKTKKENSKLKSFFISIFNNYLLPTMWATALTMPGIFVYIWQVNLMGIIANVLVLPFIPFLMMYWLIVSLLSNLSILEDTIIINTLIGLEVFVMKWVFFISELFSEVLVFKIWFS